MDVAGSSSDNRISFTREVSITIGGEAIGGSLGHGDGAGQRSFQMGGGESGRVADLLSISNDMFAVVECAEAREDVEEGGVAYRALFQAAIISYARAFKSGKSFAEKSGRRKAGLLLAGLTDEQLEVHEEVIRMRDKHVAHRVDSDEEVYVLANFSPLGHFEGLGALSTRMGSSSGLFDGLAELAQILWGRAGDLASDEMNALEQALKEQMASEGGVPTKGGFLAVPGMHDAVDGGRGAEVEGEAGADASLEDR